MGLQDVMVEAWQWLNGVSVEAQEETASARKTSTLPSILTPYNPDGTARDAGDA